MDDGFQSAVAFDSSLVAVVRGRYGNGRMISGPCAHR
jgi:hypothetical protein